MNSNRGGLILFIAIMAAALAAAPARGEVRLVEDPADSRLIVDVDATPRGPWTPHGSVTPRVLNPNGDLFGDSMPGWETRGSRVLCAWIRPGSGTVSRSIGVSVGWVDVESVPSPEASGQPLVDVLRDGWTLTWQGGAVEGRVVLTTGTLPDGRAVEPLVVGPGTLVGTAPDDETLVIITLDGSGILWATTIAFAFVPTQPIPITMRVLSRVPLGRAGQAPSSGGAQSKSGGDSPGMSEPRVHDVGRSDGSLAFLLTWWSGQDLLNTVELGSDGPLLPITTSGGGPGSGNKKRRLDAALRKAAME